MEDAHCVVMKTFLKFVLHSKIFIHWHKLLLIQQGLIVTHVFMAFQVFELLFIDLLKQVNQFWQVFFIIHFLFLIVIDFADHWVFEGSQGRLNSYFVILTFFWVLLLKLDWSCNLLPPLFESLQLVNESFVVGKIEFYFIGIIQFNGLYKYILDK